MAISIRSSTNRALLRSAIISMLVLLAAQVGPFRPECTARADDGLGILRWDPLDEQIVPVPPEELKPGCVYSHFSERMNRRVWSYVQASGEFWYALGEGTTLEGARFDIRATSEEAREKLEELYPSLGREVKQYGRIVYARLNGEGEWGVVTTAKHPTIYNLETGQRWERIFTKHPEPGNTWEPGPPKYLPVVHTWGYRWDVCNGAYVPAGQPHGMAYPAGYGAPACPCDCPLY